MTPLSLYMHWPFCVSKCPYCDFNSHVRENIDERQWQKSLVAELYHAKSLTPNHRLQTIFFGGGTPSLMSPETVRLLITTACSLWPTQDKMEVSLEANPNSYDAVKFQEFADAGINRLSLGIQSLNEKALHTLGRAHNVDDAYHALTSARNIFSNLSFDLIYARPQQTREEWKAELEHALQFQADHMSLYQLTIEKGTAYFTLHQRGDLVIPDGDVAADLYDLTTDLMRQHGYDDYEVSNYAKPGYACQHNLNYWTYQDYIGVGPGAHGRFTMSCKHHPPQKVAQKCFRAPETWLEKVEKTGHGFEDLLPLSTKEQVKETLMMGLRLKEGVDMAPLSAMAGPILSHRTQTLLIDEGVLHNNFQKIIVTPKGRKILNSVLNYLFKEIDANKNLGDD